MKIEIDKAAPDQDKTIVHYVSPQEYERMILALKIKTDWSISKNKIKWNQDKQRFEPI